tara:strand:+ start:178 stop:351 length:174 start_codon:yes stop_codon:yes gene_type:complete
LKVNNMKNIWRIWAKALGEKAGSNDKEADNIALIRSVILFINMVTCFFIIANVIFNW